MHPDGYIKNFQEIPISLVPVIDTAIYAAGDVLFAPVLFPVVSQVGTGKKLRIRIRDILVMDSDNEQALFDLMFFSANPASFGALNAAMALSDADMAASFRRIVPITSYTVLSTGLNAVAQPIFDPFTIRCAANALGFWVAGRVASGTPTFTAAGDLKLTLGCEILNDLTA